MSTELKTLNGYGFDATKLGGLDAQYYAQGRAAQNLFDNSNFQINQRGQTSYTANGYTVDRWAIYKWSKDSSVSINLSVNADGVNLSGGVSTASTPSSCYLYQKIDCSRIAGKTLTAAVYIDSLSGAGTGIIGADNNSTYIKGANLKVGMNLLVFDVPTSATVLMIKIGNDSSHAGKGSITASIKWAALYEGSYTADTLPGYVPKGYAAEMAECQWHFERLGGTFSQFLGNAVFAKAGAKSVIISIKYSPKRLSNPTLSFSNPSEYRMLQKDAVNASTTSAYSITSFDNITTETPFAFFRVNLANALASDSWLILQRADSATGAYIDVNADM